MKIIFIKRDREWLTRISTGEKRNRSCVYFMFFNHDNQAQPEVDESVIE